MIKSISVVVPYLSTSRTIELCKHYLNKFTICELEIVEIVDSTDVYDAFNSGVQKASNDLVVLLNDDMYVSPGWDILYTKYHKEDLVLTGILVEPGVVPVSSRNVCRNYGTTPETFNEQAFLDFTNQFADYPEIVYDRKGWYMPIAFNKKTFIPYPNTIKYPHPNDITLIDQILPQTGFKFAQIKSIVYHLQNFSKRG